jgi:hypothetical protein
MEIRDSHNPISSFGVLCGNESTTGIRPDRCLIVMSSTLRRSPASLGGSAKDGRVSASQTRRRRSEPAIIESRNPNGKSLIVQKFRQKCVLCRRCQLAARRPRARGTCFLCRWRDSPAEPAARFLRPRRDEDPPLLPHLNPLGRGGPESFARLARLALTRVPLVAPLGLERAILGEKPQALEGPRRFQCAYPSRIRRASVERHRARPGICLGESPAKGGSLEHGLYFRLLCVYFTSPPPSWRDSPREREGRPQTYRQ